MRNFLAVIVFSLLVIVFFTGYSSQFWGELPSLGVPQIEPAPPPKEEKLDLGAMTMDQFIGLGDRIYNGKGTCTLCHNELGRAPMLDQIGPVVADRLADERYDGEADDVESYLYESFVEPSAFVVAGFGKTGTNDTVSPMPVVNAGSIGLSEAEMLAVIAYIQDDSGLEVTVEIPTEVPDTAEEDSEGEQRPVLASAEEAIDEFACGGCHIIAGEEGELGPDLSRIGASKDREYLRRSILDPNAEIAEGYDPEMMPEDYGELMYAKELEMLVDYLAALK